ncbi:ankyrin repeat-containing domain protein [Gigaspora rosea]|uniref:Ankyrin repeat-containing domain protein n=1 Tax=Gigaspora rosea TaxID=44941 RepID=A0A397UDR0_9GLOM|nr:ankyrin repeat-containing domain protein [Gigaspora rosea]
MVNKQGQTALIYASKYGNLDPIKLLLENGADINQTDFEGNTALHYAAAWERFDAVTVLIERGCQFAVKNHSGWTALDYSYSMNLKSHLQECALSHHEESKINRRRNLKITVDSLISIDSMPTMIRSATLPPGRPSDESFDNTPNESFSTENLSPMNPVKRKESLPW